MPLQLYPALPADAGRISDIHMAAFGSNAMLLAQFPTPDVREALRESIRRKALADIDDPKITVLVIRNIPSDPDVTNARDDNFHHPLMNGLPDEPGSEEAPAGEVIAFAKWSHPVGKDEEYEETAWIWPPGTNLDILEGWGRVTEEVQEQAVGGRPCYRLTFMGTDPAHERKGAASMMVRWGLGQCKRDGVPGYLESTLDATPFYEKMGFVAFKNISLRYQVEGNDKHEVYEEIAFLYNNSSI
ncbi:putative GNAT family acetyltransferase [Xylaria grammica]|nr:putative GNAT family acetyltransferase [Xylaria grammica]